MTSKELAAAIHSILGAEEHLNRIYHCMTRLRLVFDQEESASDTERRKKIEALDGVIGTHSDGPELQIILGPGKAANVYDAFCALRQPAGQSRSSMTAELCMKKSKPETPRRSNSFFAASPVSSSR